MALPKTMRAVTVSQPEPPAKAAASDLKITDDHQLPTLRSNDALVRVKAFGLNRADIMQRQGLYPPPPQARTQILGLELSGEIVALGGEEAATESGRLSTTAKWAVGDEVFGLVYGGAYAEYVAVSTRMLIRKPKELSWETAAGVAEAWMTATQALYLVGGFQGKGKRVLWHAGASGVSLAGVQLSRDAGAEAIFVTAGSKEKLDFVTGEDVGATKGWDYHKGVDGWVSGIKEATGGKGVDLVVDFVGGPYFQGNLDVLARDGRVVLLGTLGGGKVVDGADISQLLFKRARIEGSTLRSRDEDYQGELRNSFADKALRHLTDGKFKVFVEKVFAWEDVTKAHELMEGNTSKGKIICRIN